MSRVGFLATQARAISAPGPIRFFATQAKATPPPGPPKKRTHDPKIDTKVVDRKGNSARCSLIPFQTPPTQVPGQNPGVPIANAQSSLIVWVDSWIKVDSGRCATSQEGVYFDLLRSNMTNRIFPTGLGHRDLMLDLQFLLGPELTKQFFGVDNWTLSCRHSFQADSRCATTEVNRISRTRCSTGRANIS